MKKIACRLNLLLCGAFVFLLLGPVTPLQAHNDPAYFNDCPVTNDCLPSKVHPDWMTPLPDDLRLSELSIPGTHDSGSYVFGLQTTETQGMNIGIQLQAGIRYFDLRVGQTPACPLHIFHGATCQFIPWGDVVNAITNFLAANPGETVIARIKNEYGNPSFANMKAALGNNYYGANAGETDTNPTLGDLRGKVFVMLNEWGDGNSMGTRFWLSCADQGDNPVTTTKTCQDKFSMSSQYGLEEKWHDWVVPFFNKADDVRGFGNTNRDELYINHLSATSPAWAFPFFFASGHATWGTSGSRLATIWARSDIGLFNTCADNADCVPEYPSVLCIDFFGLANTETCTVAFEGINTFARNHISRRIRDRAGIVVADFPGPDLISAIIRLNPWRPSAVADASRRNPYTSVEGVGTIRLEPGFDIFGVPPIKVRWDTDGNGSWDTPWEVSPNWPPVELTSNDDFLGQVCMQMEDANGATDIDCTLVEFTNQGPGFSSLSQTRFVAEGGTAEVWGWLQDLGLDSHDVRVDWDWDGEWDWDDPMEHDWDLEINLPVDPTYCSSPSDNIRCKPFNLTTSYAENGTYLFAMEITDDDGATVRHDSRFEVTNARPIIETVLLTNGDTGTDLLENTIIPLNTLVNIGVFFSDPGITDTHSAVIHWGDGATTNWSDSATDFSRNHTYTASGQRQISVILSDDDGGTASYQSPPFYVVLPPPPPDTSPVPNAGGPYSVFEGFFINADASLSTVHPGRTAWYRWDFDNDGIWDTARSTNPVSESWFGPNPDFPDDYSGMLKVEVWDGSEASTALASVEFVNAYPTVFAVYSNTSIDEGDTAVLNIEISDPGYDDYTVRIDWDGDGVTDKTEVLPPKAKKASFSHTFPNNPPRDDPENPDPASEILSFVTVEDDEGESRSDQPNIDVYNVAPDVSITVLHTENLTVIGPPPYGQETAPASTLITLIGTVQEPGVEDTVTLTVDWDDGTTTELAAPADGYFSASHTYTVLGPKTVSVTAVDDEGAENDVSWSTFTVIDLLFEDGFEQ